MAITVFRSGNRLAPWGAFDPIARPFGRLVGDSGTLRLDRAPRAGRQCGGDRRRADPHGRLAWLQPGGDRDHSREWRSHDTGGEGGAQPESGTTTCTSGAPGRFERSFTLPRTVSAEAVTATFENGVLRVRMPKSARIEGAEDRDPKAVLRRANRRDRSRVAGSGGRSRAPRGPGPSPRTASPSVVGGAATRTARPGPPPPWGKAHGPRQAPIRRTATASVRPRKHRALEQCSQETPPAGDRRATGSLWCMPSTDRPLGAASLPVPADSGLRDPREPPSP